MKPTLRLRKTISLRHSATNAVATSAVAIKSARNQRAVLSASLLLAILFSLGPAKAANGVWQGSAIDDLWSNGANWISGNIPGLGNTATFSTASNGSGVIDLGVGGVTVTNITWNSNVNTKSFTIGSGGVNGQTLTLANGGTTTGGSNVTVDELVNAKVQLQATYTFAYNSNAGKFLTFAGDVLGAASGGTVLSVNPSSNANIVISGVIKDGGAGSALSITKTGNGGKLTLSGANTYTGNTLVQNGTLAINNVNALQNSTLDFSGATNTTGNITFNLAGNNTYNIGGLKGSGAFTPGTNDLDFGANTLSVGANNSSTTFSGALKGTGGGSLIKVGAGTLTMSGAATYTGTTTVTAGTLTIGAADRISDSSNLLVNGGAFNLNGFNETVGTVTISSGSIDGTANTLTGSSYALQGGTVNAILGGTGAIAVSSGTTALGSAGRLGSGKALTVSSGQLTIAGSESVASYQQTGGTLAGTGQTLTSSAAYDMQAGTVSANLGGTGVALNKSTSGTVTLSGSNSYTGATTVSAGVLAVNGSLANTTTTVGSGATLRGSGGIGGSVTIQNGGTLATGNSIESLKTGALSLEAGSTFAYELDKDAAAGVAGDLTAVTGTLSFDLTNAAILTLSELGTSGSWTAGEKLTLISYSGTWNNGLFNYLGNTLNDDSTFTFSGATWMFNYNDNTAGTNYTSDLTTPSYVTMIVIPEPNCIAAFIGGLGILSLRRRR